MSDRRRETNSEPAATATNQLEKACAMSARLVRHLVVNDAPSRLTRFSQHDEIFFMDVKSASRTLGWLPLFITHDDLWRTPIVPTSFNDPASIEALAAEFDRHEAWLVNRPRAAGRIEKPPRAARRQPRCATRQRDAGGTASQGFPRAARLASRSGGASPRRAAHDDGAANVNRRRRRT